MRKPVSMTPNFSTTSALHKFGLMATSLFIGVWLALAGLAWWVVPIYWV